MNNNLGHLGKKYIWIFAGIACVILLSMGLALILPQRENVFDFVTLYAANFAIIHHVPLYSTSAIENLMITQLNLEKKFTLYPYPYPPWYALSTFFLAFLPPHQSVNAWALLNAAMLLTCVFLLTENWKPMPRILAALAVMMFIPSIGLIIVGQYSAPILLGAILFIYAVKREEVLLAAFGLLLLTFKPHLGLFLFPAGIFWLVFQNTPFARRTIWLTLGGGLLLATLGFIADPIWPLNYFHALTDYTAMQGVKDLGLSAGFSAMLIKLIFGQGSVVWATWLSVAFIVIMLIGFWRFKVFANLEMLFAATVLLTLLGDPYLLNYDYILIILPLAYLLKQSKSLIHRIMLGLIYFVPWLSLILERSANILYAVGAIFLLVILFQKSQKST